MSQISYTCPVCNRMFDSRVIPTNCPNCSVIWSIAQHAFQIHLAEMRRDGLLREHCLCDEKSGKKCEYHRMTPGQLEDLERKISDAQEQVDHPSHYRGGDDPYEHVKVAEAMGWEKDSHIYNCTKYIWRLGKKDNTPIIVDLKKALWYLKRRVANEEKGGV